MVGSTGFFANAAVKHEQEKTVFNAGKDPFFALALGLIDALKQSPRTVDDCHALILQRFLQAYPDFIAIQAFRTPSEQIQALLHCSRKTEVPALLASVLRQISLDEIQANPLAYRDLCADLSRQVASQTLQKADFIFPPRVLKAAAQALGLRIILQLPEREKPLWAKQEFVKAGEHPKFEVMLQFHDDYYFPRIQDSSVQLHSAPLLSKNRTNQTQHSDKPLSLDKIMTWVDADNQKLLAAFQKTRKTLVSMMDANELSRASLMAAYIAFVPPEAGPLDPSRRFFMALEQDDAKPIETRSEEDLVCKALIETLASWVVLGYADEDQLFESLVSNQIKTELRPVS